MEPTPEVLIDARQGGHRMARAEAPWAIRSAVLRTGHL